MAGYTGKLHGDAGSVSAHKVAQADRGRRQTVNDKLTMVELYIRREARTSFGGDIDQVPCPDVRAWSKLSSGHTPALPSTAQMGLFSTQELRDSAAELGHMRLAYFEAARANLKRSNAQN